MIDYEDTRNDTRNIKTINTQPAHQQPRHADQFAPAIHARQKPGWAAGEPAQFRAGEFGPHEPFGETNDRP